MSCGRLSQFFQANVKDLVSSAKVSLQMIAIIIQQTQFKTLASKLHVLCNSLQKELGRLIQYFKAQHVILAQEGSMNGADLSCLSQFAGLIMEILSASNEIVAAAESSAAAMRKKPDEQGAHDDAKEAVLHDKIAKGNLALSLLRERLQAIENSLTVKPAALSRGSNNPNRQNPSRRV